MNQKMRTTTIKKESNKVRHTLVVCLTSCLFLFGLSIAYWNYKATKEDNQKAIKRDFNRIGFLINELTVLKKDQVKDKVSQISELVKFRSALSTSDDLTVIDALNEIKNSHDLSFIAILKNKRILYIDNMNKNVATTKELVRSHFIAAKKLKENLVLLIGTKFTKLENERWSKITGANITQIKALPFTGKEVNRKGPRVSSDNKWYIDYQSLLKGTLILELKKDRQAYWSDFEAREKETVVFMGILFLCCLVASWIIGGLISKLISDGNAGQVTAEEFKGYVQELRSLKGQG
jgi:hypothetical protein